jgi:DNA repair protein RecO (recombination protein O)
MLHKTEGIVLNAIKYRESSLIVKIYTSEFGLLSYIVNNVRTAKPRFHSSVFQPLTVVELVTYFSSNKPIQRFSEIKPVYQLATLESPTKTCIKLFLSEFLSKILKEEVSNIELFEFIKSKLIELSIEKDFVNFHLHFLIDFTEPLGINIRESMNLDTIKLDAENLSFLNQLLEGESILLNRYSRLAILQFILEYYNHFHQIGEIKSVEILSEVLD